MYGCVKELAKAHCMNPLSMAWMPGHGLRGPSVDVSPLRSRSMAALGSTPRKTCTGARPTTRGLTAATSDAGRRRFLLLVLPPSSSSSSSSSDHQLASPLPAMSAAQAGRFPVKAREACRADLRPPCFSSTAAAVA